jgi:hypothetical protein
MFVKELTVITEVAVVGQFKKSWFFIVDNNTRDVVMVRIVVIIGDYTVNSSPCIRVFMNISACRETCNSDWLKKVQESLELFIT